MDTAIELDPRDRSVRLEIHEQRCDCTTAGRCYAALLCDVDTGAEELLTEHHHSADWARYRGELAAQGRALVMADRQADFEGDVYGGGL